MTIGTAEIGRGCQTRQTRFRPNCSRWARVVALTLALAAAACAPHTNALANQTSAASDGPGGPFTLVNQDGQAVDQRVLNGKWSIVFFGYTFCPDFCPTTLTTLGQAMTQLGPAAQKVQVVFITVDPDRDSPKELKTYLSSRVFPKNIIGLTGTPAQIAQAAKAYGVYYQKDGTGSGYTVDHSTAIYVMDPQGHYHGVIKDGLTPQEEARQIAAAIDGTA